MVKLLKILTWSSGAVGIIMMLLGVVTVLAGGILWEHRWSNYFYPGVGFVVLGIFLLLATILCREKE